MFGKIKLEEFKGLTAMPQKAASAWSGAELENLVGASYKPLLYLGSQIVKGTNYFFIVEITVPYSGEIRKVALLAINEFDGKYTPVKESIEVIL